MFGFQGLRVEKDIDHGIAVLDDLVLCGEQLVCRPEEGCLNLCIGKVRSGAGLIAVVFMIALPDGLPVFAVGMPDLRSVPAAAFAAFDLGGEGVDSAVVFLTPATAFHLALNHLEYVWVDDGFMVSLNVVLRNLALVDLCLLGQEIDSVGFLQQGITFVFLVPQDALDRGGAPFGLASGSEHAVLCEFLRDAVVCHAFKEKLVDAFDGHGLLRVDDQITVSAFVISEEPLIGDGHFAVSKSLTLSPCAVLRNAPALLLSEAGHNGQE